ncbi:hypothetical protein [Halopseudomonas sp.]|uniref:hypothetical protein n=1 Tax=Halopseudomonas sp. TaxID=2901191 RepID=UPI0030039A7B
MSTLAIENSFSTDIEHRIERTPLDEAIAGLEGAAARFSLDAISDANVRSSYSANIRRVSVAIRQEVAAGRISALEGARYCHEMRNKIMAEHRKFTSVQGLAQAERMKKTPPTIPQLFERYAKDQFGKSYESLTAEQKRRIHYTVIEAAGRDNARITRGNQRLQIIGKVGVLITAAFATYEILNADNKVKETARQGMIIGGGVAGGFLAGLGVSLICGPGAPVCAIALVLAGSAAGGLAGSAAANSFDEELEEFSRWEIL